MKTKYIILLLLLTSFSINAQFGRRPVNRTPVNTRAQKPPEVNIEKLVGIYFYDIEKTTKKIGIKKSDKNYNKIVSLLNTFNKEQRDITRINSFLLSDSKNNLEAAQKSAQAARDYSIIQNAYTAVAKKLKPLIDLTKQRTEKLTKSFEEILSKKQFKKWNKYLNKLKNSRK